MGKLVATEFVTLDGVFEDPGGQHGDRGGWAFQFDRGDAGDRFKYEELMAADAQLLGRVTYERFAATWPTMTGDLADKVNSLPKHVASTTLTETTWNAEVLTGDAIEAVAQLKESGDGTGSKRTVRMISRFVSSR